MNEGEAGEERASVQGALLVKTRADKTLDIVLRDMELSDSQSEKPMPSLTLEGMRSDGTMPASKRTTAWYVGALFPLPDRPLEVGETAKRPFQVPFNAAGKLLHASGTVHLKLAGYVEFDGRTCAHITSWIEVPRLEVPEDVQGDYDLSLFGEGTLLFDLEADEVAASELAAVMRLDTGEISMEQNHYIRVHPRTQKNAK